VKQFGLTSKTLRYYERVGLLEAKRTDNNNYRYYDESDVERIKQIVVLRKMQISIKDIIRIYESEDMSVVVETFVSRIRDIDEQVGALTELRAVVNDFLQAMQHNGVTKISVLPILYEKMEKRLDTLERRKPVSYKELSVLSDKLAEPVNPAIINLPSMRVLSSCRKDVPDSTNPDDFWRWAQAQNIALGEPGQHDRFEFQTEAGDVVFLRISDDFVNGGEYRDACFGGGLYATLNVYLDEDMGQRFKALVSHFDGNKFYEMDYTRETMLENLLSPDENRELVSLLVPVKKRLANPALFGAPEEVTGITAGEIEAANPVLWEVNVPPDKLTPEPEWAWGYHVNEQGEGEYCPVIDTHWLSTGVNVKLPFRVDIEFLLDDSTAAYGYGADEGGLGLIRGTQSYYVNKGNYAGNREEAIEFDQPIFGNRYRFPGIGKLEPHVYNRLTWIIGEKYLAVIVNGEARYCGVIYPYMSANWHGQEPQTVLLTANGSSKWRFKSVRVAQLAKKQKTKMKEGELSMITSRSNNVIPIIHRLITSDHGENYHFNGCARYVMECLGEKEYTYGFFALLTGDEGAQIYGIDKFRGDGVTDVLTGYDEGHGEFIEGIFEKCGYASTFVPKTMLQKNREMYLRTLLSYIDRGTPVIEFGVGPNGPPWGVWVGYEEYGKTLLLMTDNNAEPVRVSLDEAVKSHWVFVGEKQEQKELNQIYRDAVADLPTLLTTKTANYCFGAAAFRAWADDIENGKFDGMKLDAEGSDLWPLYTSYVCNLATNGSCFWFSLGEAMEQSPDMTFLEDVRKLYQKTANMWNNDNGGDLEALGGGFNVTLEALQNREKRGKIVMKIREFADVADEIVRALKDGLKQTEGK